MFSRLERANILRLAKSLRVDADDTAPRAATPVRGLPGIAPRRQSREHGDGGVTGVHPSARGPRAAHEALARILEGAGWQSSPAACRVLRPILLRMCGRYLMFERRGRKALDQVGNFHVQNGATIERLNFGADLSAKVRSWHQMNRCATPLKLNMVVL